MHLIGSVNTITNGYTSAIFGLRAPAAGNNLSLKLAWTGSAESFIAGCDWTGVNQTNDATAFPGFTSSTGSNNTVTVTSAVGDIVFASIGSIPNVALTGTTIYKDTTHGAVINGGANYDVGAATVAIGVTSGAGNDSGIVAADIKAN